MKASNFVGMSFSKFKANYSNIDYRIEREDGEQKMLDADFNPNRLNLMIENGIITNAEYF